MEFAELLDELRISHKRPGEHHHATTGFIQFDCPFCSSDSGKYRMGYNLAGHYTICWTCGSHQLVSTLHELTHEDWPKCREWADALGGSYHRPDKTVLARHLKWPTGLEVELTQAHRTYLKSRKINPARAERLWGLRSLGLSTKGLSHRLFIPVIHEGKTVSWTTRSTGSGVRYKNAPATDEELSPKELLFGADYAGHAVIVCEGPFDVFRIGPGAVATMGVGYSKAQLLKISQFPVRYICFDNEYEAQKRAKQLCQEVCIFPGKTSNLELDAKDAGSANNKEIRELRALLLTPPPAPLPPTSEKHRSFFTLPKEVL